METVVVLMATYNGEKYLEEQLSSILGQKGVAVEIVIRDDASTDNTVPLIQRLMRKHPNITLITGENVGSAKNFWKAAQHVSAYGREYYAFADQDDIWYEDKLVSAVEAIGYRDTAVLYFSELDLIDANGKVLGRGLGRESFCVNKRCALVQNQATGCTMVFNKKALQLLVEYEPAAIQMHDFWMFQLMSFFGTIIYDKTPRMGYRQHGNNVVGAKVGLRGRWKARLKYIRRLGEHPREDMARELLAGYRLRMSSEDIRLAAKVAFYRESLAKRLGLFFDRSIRMSDMEKDFWYRMRILAGDI